MPPLQVDATGCDSANCKVAADRTPNRSRLLLTGAVLCAAAGWPAQDAKLYRAQMAAAEYALRLGEQPIGREWLEATDPAARGLEWQLRRAALDASLACCTVDGDAAGNADVVAVLAANPDGTLLACGTTRGSLQIRSAADGAVLRTVDAHTARISQVRWSRDGRRLVTASHDRRVRVFAGDTLQPLAEFTGHGFPVGGADFAADGATVASCSYERPGNGVVGTVHIWNSADGRLLRTLHGGSKPLAGISFSPDGTRFACPSWDFCLFVWNVNEADDQAPLLLPMPDEGIYNAVDGIAWSPDGRLLAGAGRDHTARIWNTDSGDLVASLRGHSDAVADLRFAPDGKLLATASADGTVKLWRTGDWSLAATLRGHGDDVLDVAFAAAGKRLWSCATDGTLRVWDPDCPWYEGATMRTSHAAYTVRWSRDGHRLATVGYDGRLQLFCADTQQPLASLAVAADGKSCHMLEWCKDDRWLVTGGHDKTVRVVDALLLTEIAKFEHSQAFTWLRATPDGRYIAACSGKEVLVYSGAERRLLHTFQGHQANVLSVAFDRGGETVVSCGRDGKALVWRTADGEPISTIVPGGADIASAAFTAYGVTVIVGERSGRVAEYDVGSGALRRELATNRQGFDHLEISPAGERIVLASRHLTLIDTQNGGIVGNFAAHTDQPHHAAFDPMGTRIASCSTDRTLQILDSRPLRERLAARDAAAAAQAAAGETLRQRLAGGATLAPIAEQVLGDATLDPTARAAWLAVIVAAAAAR